MPLSTYTPSSDIVSGWNLVGAATHSLAVQADNGDTSYIFLLYSGIQLDIWGGSFNTPIPEWSVINSVVARYRLRTTNTLGSVDGGSYISSAVRINGNNLVRGFYPFELDSNGTAYHNASETWVTNPATGKAWVPADFNYGFQGIGVNKDISQLTPGQIRITRAWLEVTWTAVTPKNTYSILDGGASVGDKASKTPVGLMRVIDVD